MVHKKIIIATLLLMLCAAPAFAVDESDASEAVKNTSTTKTGSGLPVPRFASLRASDVNLRTGPGTRYPIDWVFTHRGMPIEITAEYELWRRVRNAEGDEGWVHKNALSGKRTAIVTGSQRDLRTEADTNAAIAAHLEAGAIGQLVSCSSEWCRLKFDNVKGYLKKSDFWGAYAHEVFD